MKKYLKCGYAIDEGRLAKARKIETILLDFLESSKQQLSGMKIIDIGCGSGQMAAYFSDLNQVSATDIVDQLSPDIRHKIKFKKLKDDNIPYPDAEFDIVILNHVIAHSKNKLNLLTETARILKKGGICYIANPNRFYPTEPCYGIPLLHYLPDFLFLKITRWLCKNKEEVFFISCSGLKRLSKDAGFTVIDYTVKIINNPEKYLSEYKLPLQINLPEFASILSPTNIFILRK